MSDGTNNITGRYIYCITRTDDVGELIVNGIDDLPVSLVTSNGLAAVVSPSEVKRYRLNRQHTLAHESVIEKAMEKSTVLPVKFGTVAESEAQIHRKVLIQRAADLKELLASMDGKVEMGVKVMWHSERIYTDIVENNPVIRKMRDVLLGLPPEETHYERINLGKMVEDALAERKVEMADWIIDELTPFALDVKRNDVYGDTMVLNASFLIEKIGEPAFDKAVDAVDAQLNGLVTVKYVGPLPPFNFVDLVISWY